MGRRHDKEMGNAIDAATSRLTPDEHQECIDMLVAAEVPLETISRVIFLPHQVRRTDRRSDHLTASIIHRARGILHCSDEQDAKQYLLMKQIPLPLIMRALYDLRHRAP